MKILITGIPGTGKTSIGDYLESQNDFLHLDMENTTPEKVNLFLNEEREKKVITWGFPPGANDADIKSLQDMGYRMFWFDGNREAAHREFSNRRTVSEELWDAQLKRIESLDLAFFQPIIFNPFGEDGLFLNKEIFAQKIILLASN